MSDKTSKPLASYNEKGDVAHLRFRPGRSVGTRTLEWGGLVDLDADGKVVSATVFPPTSR
jgi:uncharacterized protein YuzE